MSKYQALIEALEAGPTEGPWSVDKSRALRVRNESDETITSAGCTDSLRHEWEANAAYIAAANPSTIRALLADLERAEKDAERYRWLRDTNNAEGLRIFNDPAACQDAEWLDAAIDAALAQMAGG